MQIFNTLTRQKEEFVPQVPGEYPGFTQVLGLPVTIFPDMCLVRSNT